MARDLFASSSEERAPNSGRDLFAQVSAPTQQAPEQPQQPFESQATDVFTGRGGAAETTKDLPELNESGILAGLDPLKGAAITPALMTATDPNEIAQIITSTYPEDITTTYEKAPDGTVYPVLQNRKTGAATPINQPGLTGFDMLQGAAIASAFTPAGRTAQGASLGAKALQAGAQSGLTSAAIEGAQALSGGEFDAAQVGIDAALGGLFEPAAALAKASGRPIKDVFASLARKAGYAPEEIAKAQKAFTPSGTQNFLSRQYERVSPNVDLPPQGLERTARAESGGVQLSQSQASKDFAQQEAEQTLLASASPEGDIAREFADKQQAQIKDLLTSETEKYGGSSRLKQALGEEADISVSAKNEQIRDALVEGKELSRVQVKDLYDQASQIDGDAIPLNNDLLLDAADEAIVSMPTDPAVKTQLEYALAKFGMIGKETGKKGRNRTVIDDDGKTIDILGDVTPLNLNNSEQFRKELNKAVVADQTGAAKQVVRTLDAVVEDAAATVTDPARKEAYQAARGAAAQKAKTFNSKDIVQKLTSYKKGTQTPQVYTQDVINSVVKGKGSLDNTKAVLKAMGKYEGAGAVNAKKALASESLGDIFSQAINKDTMAVSGARLNSAVKKYDPETLKLLLGKEGYNNLKNIQKIVGDATIPVPRTTNPSGTAYRVFNAMEKMGNMAGFGQFNFGSLAMGAAKKGKELKDRRATLKGLTENKLKEMPNVTPENKSKMKSIARIAAILELRQEDENKEGK